MAMNRLEGLGCMKVLWFLGRSAFRPLSSASFRGYSCRSRSRCCLLLADSLPLLLGYDDIRQLFGLWLGVERHRLGQILLLLGSDSGSNDDLGLLLGSCSLLGLCCGWSIGIGDGMRAFEEVEGVGGRNIVVEILGCHIRVVVLRLFWTSNDDGPLYKTNKKALG